LVLCGSVVLMRGRMFGPPDGMAPLPQVVAELMAKAGLRAVVPPRLSSLCCGLTFSSHGVVYA
jgi:hypothetical protein